VTELQLPVQTEAELRKVNERQAIRIRQLDASVKNLLAEKYELRSELKELKEAKT
jgi:hypothetical protein